jgi:hypothetical protein
MQILLVQSNGHVCSGGVAAGGRRFGNSRQRLQDSAANFFAAPHDI